MVNINMGNKVVLDDYSPDDFRKNMAAHSEKNEVEGVKNLFESQSNFLDKEIDEFCRKRAEDYSYGSVDLRSLKSSNFSDSFARAMLERIDASGELIADCSADIDRAAQDLLTKNKKYFIPNKAAKIDPNKWWFAIIEKYKYVVFGKTIAIDVHEKNIFNELGLKTEKDIQAKLDIVKEFHTAVKSGNNTSIDYAVANMNANWYGYLGPRYVDIVTEMGHAMYYKPTYLDLLPVHNAFYGTIPAAKWFLYPFMLRIGSFYSRDVPNLFVSIGPPLELFKKPPFPGNMLIEIGAYIKYSTSLFGGKITLIRNEKEY